MEDDAISVEWVKLPSSARTLPRRTRLQPIQSLREVQNEQPQQLPLQTVTPVGPTLVVDLPQKKEPFPLSENRAVSLDKDLSVEANLISTPSAAIPQDTLTVEGGSVPAQRELPRGVSLQRGKNQGAATAGGFLPAQKQRDTRPSS